MKKILSVMLAIMMLFGALTVSASAASTVNGVEVSSDQVVILFDFNGGSATNPELLWDYDPVNGFYTPTSVSGKYYMLPRSSDEMVAGRDRVYFPAVTGPSDTMVCSGWMLESSFEDVGAIYGAGGGSFWKIPAEAGGQIVLFRAVYTSTEGEGDTLKTILGVLTKVFGTILGLLFFDGSSAQGIQTVDKLLGSLL